METDERTETTFKDMSTQTDMTFGEIVQLEEIKNKYDNKEELTRELAIAKITSSNESVKKYTGLPFKKILDGVFGKCIVIKKLLKIFVNL